MKAGDKVTGRYHEGIGTVISLSRGFENTFYDVQFATDTKGTKGGVVTEYHEDDLIEDESYESESEHR